MHRPLEEERNLESGLDLHGYEASSTVLLADIEDGVSSLQENLHPAVGPPRCKQDFKHFSRVCLAR